MTSKEALEEILLEARFIFDYKTINGKRYTPQDFIKTIKQDLESLEIVNKNFDKTLKTSVELINKNLELQARLEVLEKENKALRNGIDLDLNAKLLSENEKLKKVIEILKTKIGIEKVGFEDMYYLYLKDFEETIEDEQYELLKVVLK